MKGRKQMTNEEAIVLLEAGRYSEPEYLQAKNIAVKALKRQTAVPVDEPASGARDWKICPNCERFISRYERSHGNVEIPCCKWCGQKLDWSGAK